MSLFRADSVALCYSNLNEAKRWWISAFNCKQVKVPPDWDNPLPSDVALKLPGDNRPTVLLSDRAEVTQAGFDRSAPAIPVIFSDKLKKAHENLANYGILTGPIQGNGETEFSEIRDIEGKLIEICKEPEGALQLPCLGFLFAGTFSSSGIYWRA